MRTRALVGLLAAATLTLAGCGTTTSGDGSSASSPSSSSKHMSGMDMHDASAKQGPSENARMVCEEDEVRDAVKRTFLMTEDPRSTQSWSRPDRLFTCHWAVPQGTLVVQVHDATDPEAGKRYFDELRGRLDGVRKIRGLDNFNFPAYDTKAGDVLFLKDGKTLHVDATGLPDSSLPQGFSRSGVAYSVAAAVIACWTE